MQTDPLILVHNFGALRVLMDADSLRVLGVESRIPTVPVESFTSGYLAQAVQDAEAFAHSLGY